MLPLPCFLQLRGRLKPAYEICRAFSFQLTPSSTTGLEVDPAPPATDEWFSTLPALQQAMEEQLSLAKPNNVLKLLHIYGALLASSDYTQAASVYDTALRACAMARDGSKALRLVGQMWRHKVPVGHMAQLNVLRALCASGRRADAFAYLKKIPGSRLSGPLFYVVLEACAASEDNVLGQKCWSYLQHRGIQPDALLWRQMILLQQSATEGSAQIEQQYATALKKLSETDHCAVASARIMALANGGFITQAIDACRELFDTSADILPLDLSTSPVSSSWLSSILMQQVESKPSAPAAAEYILSACNATLREAESLGDFSAIQSLVNLMTERGVPPNTETYNILFRAAIHQGEGPGVVQEGIEEMRTLGIQPNVHTVLLVLRLYANKGDVDGAWEAFNSLRQFVDIKDVSVWNELLLCSRTKGDVQGLGEMYEKMLSARAVPNVRTFCILFEGIKAWTMSHASTEGDGRLPASVKAEKAQQRHAASVSLRQWSTDMKELGLKHNISSLTAAISAYGVIGDSRPVLKLLKDHFVELPNLDGGTSPGDSVPSHRKGKSSKRQAEQLVMSAMESLVKPKTMLVSNIGAIPASLRTFNAAISACSRAGHLAEAAVVLKKMEELGLKADIHTYCALINGCSKARKAKLAHWLFQHMASIGIQPNIWTYNALIKVEGFSGGGPAAALAVVNEMVDKGVQPDRVTWNTILSAARQHDNIELEQRAMLELRTLEEAQTSPSQVSNDGDEPHHWRSFFAYGVDEDEW